MSVKIHGVFLASTPYNKGVFHISRLYGIGLGAMGVILGVGLVGVIAGRASDVDSLDAVLGAQLPCLTSDQAVSCAHDVIAQLMEFADGAAIMDALSQHLSPRQCHLAGHVVGQQMFRRFGDSESAIANCSRACDSACIHGIIGEAFIEELGYSDEDFDYRHMSDLDLRRIGNALCTAPQACHGVGHAIFQTHGMLTASLDLCRTVASRVMRPYCYHGVFMEYADVLQDRSVRSHSSLQPPSLEQLPLLCDFSDADQRRACYRYFPRFVAAALVAHDSEESDAVSMSGDICRSLSGREARDDCVAGVGSFSSYLMLDDPQATARRCARFEDARDRVGCVIGVVSVSTSERRSRIFPFCAVLNDDREQSLCFAATIYYLGPELNGIERLCGDNRNCLAEAGKSQVDPWTVLPSL